MMSNSILSQVALLAQIVNAHVHSLIWACSYGGIKLSPWKFQAIGLIAACIVQQISIWFIGTDHLYNFRSAITSRSEVDSHQYPYYLGNTDDLFF